ncbi:MAG: 50S ribosomal protein L21 [Solirubrobacterales bacterium]
MSTYAIVESGGKQYRVEKGQSLLVDRIAEDEGAKVPLRAVMFRSDSDTVVAPADLEKVKVEAKVAGHERGTKVKVFKYKAKKGYRKRRGHRSELTRLEVTEVKMLSRKPAASKDDEPAAKEPKAAAKEASKPAAAEQPADKAASTEGLPESIGKPATKALEEAGLTTLEQVAGKTEAELLELKGIGPKAVEALSEALADAGLSLEQTDEKESD